MEAMQKQSLRKMRNKEELEAAVVREDRIKEKRERQKGEVKLRRGVTVQNLEISILRKKQKITWFIMKKE